MNNGNSSKQVLLSVLGIAVLVIAVVGVSFAFFTYSHTGDNQLITTGSIYFKFLDGQEINLTNQFPVDDTTGKAFSKQSDAKNVMDFSIVGYTTGDPIPFKIKAVSGDEADTLATKPEAGEMSDIASRTLLDDEDIKIYLTETTEAASLTSNKASSPVLVSSLGTLSDGIELASGTIKAKGKDAQETDTFELRMWISNTVTFGEDESGAKGDNKYTNEEFANKYYALKIQVVAGDAAQ